jgi:hypothetical protein
MMITSETKKDYLAILDKAQAFELFNISPNYLSENMQLLIKLKSMHQCYYLKNEVDLRNCINEIGSWMDERIKISTGDVRTDILKFIAERHLSSTLEDILEEMNDRIGLVLQENQKISDHLIPQNTRRTRKTEVVPPVEAEVTEAAEPVKKRRRQRKSKSENGDEGNLAKYILEILTDASPEAVLGMGELTKILVEKYQITNTSSISSRLRRMYQSGRIDRRSMRVPHSFKPIFVYFLPGKGIAEGKTETPMDPTVQKTEDTVSEQ